MMKFEFTKDQIERLLETYNVKDIDKLLNENVVGSIIGRILGKNVVAKLEANYSDDAIKVLDNLLAAVEAGSGNIVKGADKKLYLVSASGKKWDMNVIKKTIEGVASGKLPESALEMLPKTLKDRQSFRQIFQNQFKYGKKIGPAAPKPKPKPKATSTSTSAVTPISTIPVLNSRENLINYINSEFKKFGLKLPKQKWMDDFINDVNNYVGEAMRKKGVKNFNDSLDNLEISLNKMSTDQRKAFYNKALQNIESLSKTDKRFYDFLTTIKGSNLLTKEGISNFVSEYKKYALYILIANVVTILLDVTRKDIDVSKDQKYQFHVGDPKFTTYLYIKIVASVVPILNVLLVTALGAESIIRTGYSIGRKDLSKEKPTIKQRVKAGVKDVINYGDSTLKANQPKIDSVKNKIDSVYQNFKTDYKDQSSNNQPLTGDNRPVIKY